LLSEDGAGFDDLYVCNGRLFNFTLDRNGGGAVALSPRRIAAAKLAVRSAACGKG
jgi:hypothetical protein